MKIENIIKNDICCGCGTCAGICPNNAIEMKINERGFYAPEIYKERCIYCNNCDKVCPRIDKISNFSKLNEFVFGKMPDKVIGNYVNCYVGYSTDKDLRFEASSGGMVTQTLISALEEGIIDGAIVTRMKKDNPLIPEPFIARTKEEIMSAMGSKYCPVPLNIVLKEIIKSKNDNKYAVVGLPCHIVGIRKAEMLIPKLKEKIVLHCGLFCGATKSFIGTEYLLEKNKIKKGDVNFIKYRGKGWPGYLQIKKRDASEKNTFLLSYYYYYRGLFGMFFKNNACLSCNDYSGEFADISFGDAWGVEEEDTKGTSVIITRTKFADELLTKFYLEKNIFIKNIGEEVLMEEALMTHIFAIMFKKKLHIKVDKIQQLCVLLWSFVSTISFLNYFSTHPNKIVRKTCLLFLDYLHQISIKLIRACKILYPPK